MSVCLTRDDADDKDRDGGASTCAVLAHGRADGDGSELHFEYWLHQSGQTGKPETKVGDVSVQHESRRPARHQGAQGRVQERTLCASRARR